MCRSIHTLYNIDPPVTDEDIQAAALQYVRKVSGFRKPSRFNQAAFDVAVTEITAITARLLGNLHTSSNPHKAG